MAITYKETPFGFSVPVLDTTKKTTTTTTYVETPFKVSVPVTTASSSARKAITTPTTPTPTPTITTTPPVSTTTTAITSPVSTTPTGISITPPTPTQPTPFATRTDLMPKFTPPEYAYYQPGTIYQMQTDLAGYDKYGRPVPFVETFKIEEGVGSVPATAEETALLGEVIKAQRYEEVALGKPRGKVSRVIGELKGEWAAFGREEVIDKKWVQGLYGETKAGQIKGGIVSTLIPTTKRDILITGATLGIGAGVSAAFRGVTYGASLLPGRIGTISSQVLRVGGYAAGAGLTTLYVGDVIAKVSAAEDYAAKGEIIGTGIREFAAFGAGFAVGGRITGRGIGLIGTRGRIEIPLEKITRADVITGKTQFPTAPAGQHLGLFRATGRILPPELTGGRPGGFHVTPEVFWKGKITPKPGASELPGLYVAPEASIYFAKLGGTGYRLFPTWKSILTGDKPGIAFLQPRGFRAVGFERVKPYAIDGQTFRYRFTKLAKEGFIDVPGMKTEIEGIARTGAGEYLLTGKKFYTTIRGVRVPIDVFVHEKGLTATQTLGIGKQAKQFSVRDYSYSYRQALIEPFAPPTRPSRRTVSSSIIPSYSPGVYSSPDMVSRSLGISRGGYGRTTSSLISQSSMVSILKTPETYRTPRDYSYLISPPRTPTRPLRDHFGIKQDRKKIDLHLGFSPRYTPSLTAVAFQIKGAVPPRFLKGEVDPFARRVIPGRKVKKRKKK